VNALIKVRHPIKTNLHHLSLSLFLLSLTNQNFKLTLSNRASHSFSQPAFCPTKPRRKKIKNKSSGGDKRGGNGNHQNAFKVTF